ncbi:MAG TPA: DUF6431 domain-containing protein [Acidimicrobiales bacterium]
MAIVWPCPLSLDAYVAQGREIEIPEQFCPGCTGPMTRWSGYRRFVREAGRAQAIFVARLRCRACAVTHALLPSFCLLKRLDVAPTIGRVIEAVLDKASGVRPLALALAVPHTTARGWVRRFRDRAEEHAAAFAAVTVDLGGEAPSPSGEPALDALQGLRAAFDHAAAFPGWAVLGCWRCCSAICGGRLLATNTTSPYLVVGKRRFMPPVPNQERKGSRDDRT